MTRNCYITVSVDLQCRHGLAGSSSQRLTRWKSRCQLDYIPIWRFNSGRTRFQVPLGYWQNPFLVAIEFIAAYFFKSKNSGSLWPLHFLLKVSPNWVRPTQDNHPFDWLKINRLWTWITSAIYLHLCHIPWVTSELQVLLTLKRWGLYKGIGHGRSDHLRTLPTTRPQWINIQHSV